jgi:hypothetical protein
MIRELEKNSARNLTVYFHISYFIPDFHNIYCAKIPSHLNENLKYFGNLRFRELLGCQAKAKAVKSNTMCNSALQFRIFSKENMR